MRINQLAERPNTLLYLERYVNKGSRTYSPFASFTEVHERYRPDSPHATFALPSLNIPREHLALYANHPSPDLKTRYLSGNALPFFMHPELYEQEDENIVRLKNNFGVGAPTMVSPTASTRTVFVQE